MTLAFDTSILIDIQKKNEKTIKRIEELNRIHSEPTPLLFMVYVEFRKGIRASNKKTQKEVDIWFEKLVFLSITKKTADIMIELKERYDKRGTPIPLPDLMIASQAIEYNLTLVTKDKLFGKIEEVKKIILD